MKNREIKKQKYTREFLSVDDIKIEDRIIDFSASSEQPVDRFFGTEILLHTDEAVDMHRMNNSAPLLLDHDPAKVVGVVMNSRIEEKRMNVKVKISRNEEGQKLLNDIEDNIRRNVSIGYRIDDTSKGKADGEVLVTRWTPVEVSFVGIPADQSVGVGRAEGDELDTGTVSDPELGVVEDDGKETQNERGVKMPENTNVQAEVKPEIQVVDNSAEIRKQELARSREILAMGNQFDCRELAEKAVSDGKSVDEFRAVVLNDVVKLEPVAAADPNIGMNEREIKKYSMFRAINAIVAGNWNLAPFEKECSDEALKKCRKEETPNSFMLPFDVATKRGFDANGNVKVRANEWTAGAEAKGGYTVATEVGPMIEILMNAMFSRAAGVRVLTGLQGDLALPRHQSDTWASWWVVEATAASQLYPTLQQFTLTPKEIAAYSDISTKLLLQSSENLEAYIQNHLARRLALGIDTAIIKGGSTGGSSGAPTKGLLNTTLGINTVDFGTTTLAAAPTWAKMVQLETEVGVDNAIMPDSKLAYIFNQRFMAKMKTTLKSTVAGGNGFLMDADGKVNGYPVFNTNIMPNNAAIFGDFSKVVLGLWGGTQVLVDPYSQSSARLIRLIASQACDYNYEHVESFCYGRYALTT